MDSGSESEKNYCYAETLEDTELYVKPANHEQRKKKKYQTDISPRENMKYDRETDTYTCAAGKSLTFDYITPESKYFFSNLKNMNLPE